VNFRGNGSAVSRMHVGERHAYATRHVNTARGTAKIFLLPPVTLVAGAASRRDRECFDNMEE